MFVFNGPSWLGVWPQVCFALIILIVKIVGHVAMSIMWVLLTPCWLREIKRISTITMVEKCWKYISMSYHQPLQIHHDAVLNKQRWTWRPNIRHLCGFRLRLWRNKWSFRGPATCFTFGFRYQYKGTSQMSDTTIWINNIWCMYIICWFAYIIYVYTHDIWIY